MFWEFVVVGERDRVPQRRAADWVRESPCSLGQQFRVGREPHQAMEHAPRHGVQGHAIAWARKFDQPQRSSLHMLEVDRRAPAEIEQDAHIERRFLRCRDANFLSGAVLFHDKLLRSQARQGTAAVVAHRDAQADHADIGREDRGFSIEFGLVKRRRGRGCLWRRRLPIVGAALGPRQEPIDRSLRVRVWLERPIIGNLPVADLDAGRMMQLSVDPSEGQIPRSEMVLGPPYPEAWPNRDRKELHAPGRGRNKLLWTRRRVDDDLSDL